MIDDWRALIANHVSAQPTTSATIPFWQVAKTAVSSQSAQMEKMVLRQTYAMVSAFLLAWTPYMIICMAASIQRDNPFSPKAALVPSLFAKFSALYNSFIYLGMNKQVCMLL